MARISAFVFTMLLAVTAAWAQDRTAYVTKIDALAGPGLVTITWRDADDWPDARYEIFRSEKDPTRDSLGQATLVATVPAGTQSFDDTAVAKPSYYLVLLKDAEGTRRAYFIAGRNKTAQPIAPLASDAKFTARISQVNATLSGKSLLVAFKAVPSDRKLNVYRTVKPVKTLADLKDATLLGQTTGAASPWKDTPAPGLEFYYTVLDAVAFSEGATDVLSAANTTDRALGFPLVKLPDGDTDLAENLRPTLEANLRPLPLPLLSLSQDPTTGATLAEPAPVWAQARPVAPTTEAILRSWTKGVSTRLVPLPALSVLASETAANPTGTQKLLSQLVASYLVQKDWKTAGEQLQLLLKLELPAPLEARTHYYLGQALAQQGQVREALMEFLMARSDSSVPVGPFVDSLLSSLAATSN